MMGSFLRPWRAAALLLASLGCVLAACDSGGDPASPSSPSPPVSTTVTPEDAGGYAASPSFSHAPALSATLAPDGGAPAASLASLSVNPLALVPAFVPAIHDYYVRCAAGTNWFTVTASASPGETVALLQPGETAPAASLAESVLLGENAALVVEASALGSNVEYWVRCLPPDFPSIVITSYPDAGSPTPGYYMMGNLQTSSTLGTYAMVVNASGVPVWYRSLPQNKGVLNVDSIVPGAISYTPVIAATFAPTAVGQYEIDQLSRPQVQYTSTVGIPLDHHELRVLPNGDFLMLSDVIRTGVDLTGVLSYGPGSSLIDCSIQEVSPSGTVVWQWNATDHFDPVQDSTWPQTVVVSGENVLDAFHCNSIDPAANGDLLVSSRHMDSVFYVSKATGQVVWKMGGATYTKDAATYIQIEGDPETAFYGQHDARFQPDGTISLFDDHSHMTAGPARGVVYDVDVREGTATVVWQRAGAVSSSATGSFRRYADGTSVIGWGIASSGTSLVLTEVDAMGNALLDIGFNAPLTSYRAIKVPLTAFDLETLRQTAGTP